MLQPNAKAPFCWRPYRRFLFSLWPFFVLAELSFIASVWPDWEALRAGQVGESAVISQYNEARADDQKLPPLRWQPVGRALPRRVTQAFILAEDSRFYEHWGIDLEAIRQAFIYNWKAKRIALGASTISQQTAKNMFLSLSRSPLRKAQELLFTAILECQLEKAEILHVYLNIAEFGPGIFGIEAAARQYFRTSAYALTDEQAFELAATLPSPKKHNPRTRTRAFTKHVERLNRAARRRNEVLADAEAAAALREATIAASDDEANDVQAPAPEASFDLRRSPETEPAVAIPDFLSPEPQPQPSASSEAEAPKSDSAPTDPDSQ